MTNQLELLQRHCHDGLGAWARPNPGRSPPAMPVGEKMGEVLGVPL